MSKSLSAIDARRARRRAGAERRCSRRPISSASGAGVGSARRAGAASSRSTARSVSSRNSGLPPLCRQSGGAHASASMPGRASDSSSARTPLRSSGVSSMRRSGGRSSDASDSIAAAASAPASPAGRLPSSQCRPGAAISAGRVSSVAASAKCRSSSTSVSGPSAAASVSHAAGGFAQRERIGPVRRRRPPLRQQAGELVAGPRRQRLRRRQRTQQTGEQRIGHRAVARPRGSARLTGLRRREVTEEAALADAGFADHADDLAVVPGGLRRGPLRFATDQARRPQHGRRQRARRGQRRRHAALDQRGELAGLALRRGAELVVEQPAQPLVRGARRSAFAAQVVQPHHAAMRRLGQRVGVEQVLGIDKRLHQLASRLEVVGDRGERLRARGAPAFARAVDPVAELGAVGVVELAEQHAGGGLRRLAESVGRRLEIVADAVGEAQHVVGGDDVARGGPAQAEQALAQVVARALGVGIGPELQRDARARRRAVEHQHREQRGVAALQRVERGRRSRRGAACRAGRRAVRRPRRARSRRPPRSLRRAGVGSPDIGGLMDPARSAPAGARRKSDRCAMIGAAPGAGNRCGAGRSADADRGARVDSGDRSATMPRSPADDRAGDVLADLVASDLAAISSSRHPDARCDPTRAQSARFQTSMRGALDERPVFTRRPLRAGDRRLARHRPHDRGRLPGPGRARLHLGAQGRGLRPAPPPSCRRSAPASRCPPTSRRPKA